MSQTLERVVWSEGMLMAPQHFQRQDGYHEALLDARLGWSQPHAWGAASLALDEAELAAGRVALTAFSGVLPGGTALRLEAGERGAPAVRALNDGFAPTARRLDVYLTVPVERSGGASYALGDAPGDVNAARARYLIEARELRDLVGGEAIEVVRLARPHARLRLGSEPRDDCESLKLAELERDATGALRYVFDYVPPCLRIAASAYLLETVRLVLARCVAKRRALGLGPNPGAAGECTGDDLARMSLLQILGGAIPLLADLGASPDASPHAAYRVLVRLAGELSALSRELDPSELPPYAHTDLRATFGVLRVRLEQLLRIGVVGRALVVPLDARVDGMHLGRLDELALDQPDARFFLSLRAALAEPALRELPPKVAKVASWSDIPRHVGAAVSGVPLVHVARVPRGLRTDGGRQYFALDTGSAPWRGVLQERALAVHLPPPFEPASTSLELVALTVSA